MTKELLQQSSVASAPVARLAGVDEYGPRLEWMIHWVEIPMGSNLYLTAQPTDIGDRMAYEGAREDLLVWKRRALEAEKTVRGRAQPTTGKNYGAGLWSYRNHEAMLEDQTTIAQPVPPSPWSPIETAPRDGRLILGCTLNGVVQVIKLNKHLRIWIEGDGRESARIMAYWMPLPNAPTLGNSVQAECLKQGPVA